MRYFVIMGNTRVGSTWFQAGMHSLPNVFCTREIRWRMPFLGEPPPVHTYIDGTTTSIKERLDHGVRVAGKTGVTTIGAKLKFDPYGYAPPSAFRALGKILEPDVHVIFLRRSYLEIFQTWKAFGIRHLANPNAKKLKKKANSEEKARLNRFHTMHNVPLEQKQIFITSNGNVIARALFNRYRGSDHIYYSIGDAIDDLLVLFYNDIFALSAVESHPNTEIFSYQDIKDRFAGVARKLSLPVSAEECLDALDNAPTLQIEPPGVELVFPDTALKEVSGYLESLFHKVRTAELHADEVVRCDEQNGAVTFHLPGLASILAKHEETRSLLRGKPSGLTGLVGRMFAHPRRIEGHYPRILRVFYGIFASKGRVRDEDWVAQRSMFVPAAIAPQTAVPPGAKPVTETGVVRD
jgi:hypothetical protein